VTCTWSEGHAHPSSNLPLSPAAPSPRLLTIPLSSARNPVTTRAVRCYIYTTYIYYTHTHTHTHKYTHTHTHSRLLKFVCWSWAFSSGTVQGGGASLEVGGELDGEEGGGEGVGDERGL
jgi:hypothetical protein